MLAATRYKARTLSRQSRNVPGFFKLSPSESSVFQVCTEKFTVYQINLLKVQKNWFVTLFQVDSTYISKSVKKPEKVRRREVNSSTKSTVKAQDLRKSGADWNLQKQHIQQEKGQGRNMVYGLRAQSPKFDWDQGSEERAQGSEEWDQGSQGF